jgi:tRNA A37 threonylcarbamoyladenosine synthetase subunit TsaC/SUA5/YrdC
VGIRIPDNPIAIKIVNEIGNPIISTSATNRKGDVLYDPYEIKTIFNLQVDLMLSLGNLSGKSSSVIDLSGEEPVIVRKGAGDISLFL